LIRNKNWNLKININRKINLVSKKWNNIFGFSLKLGLEPTALK
jgi:hypothetical protein